MIKMFISKEGSFRYEGIEYPLAKGSSLYNRAKGLCEYPIENIYVQKLFKDILATLEKD